MILRDYQEKAVSETRQSIMSGNKKPLIVLPTGSGKSAIFGEIISLAVEKGNKCLFMVHRRNLVLQFKETLENDFFLDVGVIMAGVEFEYGHTTYVTTVQTYSRRMNLDELSLNKFFIDADIILADEAHRSVSPTHKKIFDEYEDKIIIGTTATPIRSDGQGLGEIYDCIINPVGVQELTDLNFLAPIRYFVPATPDLAKIKMVAGDYDKKELGKRVDQPKIVGDVVGSWLKYASGRKTIVFAVNVKHSIHLRDEFRRVGIGAEHLDAHSTDEERDSVFLQMERDEISVVCNVALYQEGMDVPDISCVVMARPTKSLGLCRQCIGRGMRISKYYSDLIVIDHGGCIEENGLITDEIPWSLEGKVKEWKEKEKKEPEQKTVKCKACHLVFQGSKVCPDCGSEIQSFGKEVESVDGELKELGKNKKATMAEKRRFYGMLLAWVPRQKNPNPKRVAGAYRGRFGCWPMMMDSVDPIEPDVAFLGHMRHQAIKYAKSRSKNAR